MALEDGIFDQIHDVDLKKTMETSYIDYAMSVIASRALPDVRDGLKPVQRRVLFSMVELNNGPDKPHRKCARIVGDTMGKYHPHGDSSIYGALVNMAQEWSSRYPLVDGHGNFGSVDGDGPAAMRYTEARMSKISTEMTADINKDTVDFVPNFDETEKEPSVLPSRFPNLLVNGTTGIAVGMATNIPPHNLREIINGVVKIIDNRVEKDEETTVEELMSLIEGPDFPTGGEVLGKKGIEEAYRTGRGKIKVQAKTDIETMENGKHRIVVTELPYMVNKSRVIEKIAELVRDKRVDGITTLRDESNREGMRIIIELRRDVNPKIVLNRLMKHTQLLEGYGINMLALVNNEPKVLNLKQILELYLKHQEDVVRRRTAYDLNRAEERAHILEGLLKALDHIDEVIRLIRASKNVAEAKLGLMERFGLTDPQAQAIVDMRLRALTGLERSKLENEYKELQEKIAEFRAILGDEKKLLGVIREEILVVREKYADERRTKISWDFDEFDAEDLIPDESTIVARTSLGYIKRMSIDNFRAQNRGGKGIKGMQTIESDALEDLLMTTTHHYLLFFTNQGRVYRIKTYEIPEASRTSRGIAIVNLLQLQPEETVSAIIPIREFEESGSRYLIMATKDGFVKKTLLREYENIRKTGLNALTLREGDALIEVKLTRAEDDVFLVTKMGQCIRFDHKNVRPMGRTAMGVSGIRLTGDDEVIAMQLAHQGEYLLFVSKNGYGKRTAKVEFGKQFRGGKGLRCYRIMDKTGPLVGMKILSEKDEILAITEAGILIRVKVEDISEMSRITSGVRIIHINTEENESVASIAKVRESEEAIEKTEEDSEEETNEEDEEVFGDEETYEEDEFEDSEEDPEE